MPDKRARLGTPLTGREIDVLRLMANGHSLAETATILKITNRTVIDRLATIRARLGVPNTTVAVVRYLREHPEDWRPLPVRRLPGARAKRPGP